jgi:hypothetical protein
MFNLRLTKYFMGLLCLVVMATHEVSRLPVRSMKNVMFSNSESGLPAQWAAWETDFGGAGNAVAVDSNGDVYVTGGTSSSLYAPYQGGVDYVVAKLNGGDGSFIWGFQDGTSQNDGGNGVAVDSNGDVYVTGITSSSLYAPIQGNKDYFVAKLNGGDGSFIWGFQNGTSQYYYGNGVAVDSNGDVYVTGGTSSSLYAPYQGGYDYFVAKLNGGDGSFIWGFQDGSAYVDIGFDIWIMVNGNIGVGGNGYDSSGLEEKTFTAEIDGDTVVLVSIDDDSATHYSPRSYTSDNHVFYDTNAELVTAGCSFNYYGVDGGPPCTACAHSSSTTGSSSCTCDEGYYSSSGYAPCTACEKGSSPDENGSRSFCTCDAGYHAPLLLKCP